MLMLPLKCKPVASTRCSVAVSGLRGELAMHLPKLPAELVVAIAAQLAEDDELAFALACRRLHQAVAGTERRAAGARLSTRIGSAARRSARRASWSGPCRLVGSGLPLSGRLLLRAARAGQLEQLSWLRARGCAWEPCEGDGMDCCSSADAGGHLAVLQWARADGCPWDACTCSEAAANGHLHMLQWAFANGCPLGGHICRDAARGGHLAVLQLLRASACPWDEHTCRDAAFGGHLAVLQWVHAIGCPWRAWTCACAATSGHEAVLKWARANGCPEDESDEDNWL
jgi:hypothetical protein